MLAVSERRTDCRGRTVPDAISSRAADELIVLVEGPQTQGPVAHPRCDIGDERPILVFDLGPYFCREARGANRTGVPGVRRVHPRLLKNLCMSLRQFSS